MQHTFLIHSFADGHLSYSCSYCEQCSCEHWDVCMNQSFCLFQIYAGNGISGPYVRYIYIKELPYCSPQQLHQLHSHHQCTGAPFSPYLHCGLMRSRRCPVLSWKLSSNRRMFIMTPFSHSVFLSSFAYFRSLSGTKNSCSILKYLFWRL